MHTSRRSVTHRVSRPSFRRLAIQVFGLLVLTGSFIHSPASVSAQSATSAQAVASPLVVEDLDAPASVAFGSSLHITWTVKNRGLAPTQPTPIRFLLSADDQAVGTGVGLGGSTIPALNAGQTTPTQSTTIQTLSEPFEPARYFLQAVILDAGQGSVDASASIPLVVLDIGSHTADLAVRDLDAPLAVPLDGAISVSWSVENRGTQVSAPTRIGFYLSETGSISTVDTILVPQALPALDPGGRTALQTSTLNLSDATFVGDLAGRNSPVAGVHYLLAIADDGQFGTAADKVHAIQFVPLWLGEAVGTPAPNLVIDSVKVQSASSTQAVVGWTVENVGVGSRSSATTATFYMATDSGLQTPAAVVSSGKPTGAPQNVPELAYEGQPFSQSTTLPPFSMTAPGGVAYLYLVLGAAGQPQLVSPPVQISVAQIQSVPTVSPVAPGQARFLDTDTTTHGAWKGVYGSQGALLAADGQNFNSATVVSLSGADTGTWAATSVDPRALQKLDSLTDHLAAGWFTQSATLDVNLVDGGAHKVSVYALDWDQLNRTERIDILDMQSNVLDSENVSGYSSGVYLSWQVTGHVQLRMVNTGPYNAELSAIFNDPAPAPQH